MLNGALNLYSAYMMCLQYAQQDGLLYESHVWVADDGSECILYVVKATSLSDLALLSKIQAYLETPGNFQFTVALCSVNRIPRDDNGKIKYECLLSLPAVNADELQRWQEEIKIQNGIHCAGTLTATNVQPARIHLGFTLNRIFESSHTEINNVNDIVVEKNIIKSVSQTEKQDACLRGVKLKLPDGAPLTMVEALLNTVEKFPQKGICYIDEAGHQQHQTYAELLREAKCVLAALNARALQSGDFVVLQFTDLRNHLTALWSCLLGGIIPLTVASAAQTQTISLQEKLVNALTVLGNAKILAGDGLAQRIHQMDAVREHQWQVIDYDALPQLAPAIECKIPEPGATVFHQLTSGSTGNSKCVQITHEGVVAHINAIAQFSDYNSNNVGLNWLPLDHVAPILMMHFKDLYLGIEHILVHTSRILSEPLTWLDYLESFKVTHTWAPNFGFKLVIDALKKNPHRQWQLSHVEEMLNAGEQVTLGVISEFLTMTAPFGIRENAMRPCYGSAETCTAITYQNHFSFSSRDAIWQHFSTNNKEPQTFIAVGQLIPGVEISIRDERMIICAQGEVGRLWVKGDVVTPGYLNNPAVNAISFSDGWYDTGDLGVIANNNLVLTGRAKEVIIIQGANYYCYDLEAAIEKIQGVKPTFAAACGVRTNHQATEQLALFFVATKNDTDAIKQTVIDIKRKVAAEFGIVASYVLPLNESEFPKTTSGKIQRNQLKDTFESGAYSNAIQDIDLLLANEHTLVNWFFKNKWIQAPVAKTQFIASNNDLVFFTDRNNAQALLQSAFTSNVFCIVPGTEYENSSDKLWIVHPDQEDDFYQVFRQINAQSPGYDLINLWPLYSATHSGFLSGTLNSLKSLFRLTREKNATYLLVEQINSQSFSADMEMASGLLRAARHELPGLTTRHLKVCADTDFGSLLDLIRQEVRYIGHEDSVTFIGQQRLKKSLALLNVAQKKLPPAFRRDGIYLITGGLGGVGFEIAQSLIETVGCQLILIGRSAADTAAVHSKMVRLQGMANARVDYHSVNVADPLQVQSLFASIPVLDGVIHMAALYEANTIEQESMESIAKQAEVKLYAAQHLARCLQEKAPAGLFISFSSIFGYFGAATLGAYTAVNSALEAFSHYLHSHSQLRSLCVAWSNWDDIGMSRGYKNSDAKGFCALTARQGFQSLLIALEANEPVVYVGLDATKNYVAREIVGDCITTSQVTIYYETSHYDLSSDEIPRSDLRDFRGNKMPVIYRPINSLPRREDGSVDVAALGVPTPTVRSTRGANFTEKQLRMIWAEILNADHFSLEDNFFEVGGSSILVPTLVKVISDTFTKPYTAVEFFKYPSIAEAARYLDALSPADSSQKAISQKRIEKRKTLQARRSKII